MILYHYWTRRRIVGGVTGLIGVENAVAQELKLTTPPTNVHPVLDASSVIVTGMPGCRSRSA